MLDHRDGVKVIARRHGGQTSLRAELVRVAVSLKKAADQVGVPVK